MRQCTLVLFAIAVIALASVLIAISINPKNYPLPDNNSVTGSDSSQPITGGAIPVQSSPVDDGSGTGVDEGDSIDVTDQYADEQMLQIAEDIVQHCNVEAFGSSSGRSPCQILCRNHFCCFDEDEYNCRDDATKMCVMYAGCEALVIDVDSQDEDKVDTDAEVDGVISSEGGGENSGNMTQSSVGQNIGTSNNGGEENLEYVANSEEQQRAGDDSQSVEGNEGSLGSEAEPSSQALMQIAESIVEYCNQDSISTGDCQDICQDHLCCFDENENCLNDETKYCPVYAGCEPLNDFLFGDESSEMVEDEEDEEDEEDVSAVEESQEYVSNVQPQVGISSARTDTSAISKPRNDPQKPPPPPSKCIFGPTAGKKAEVCREWEREYGMSAYEYLDRYGVGLN